MTLESGGYQRAVWVHVPPQISEGKPLPLVLGFHGAGGSGEHFLSDNGWSAMADAKGFFVAAPEGLPARPRRDADFVTNPRLWNSGQLTAGSPRTTIDDVAFVAALLDALKVKLPYDAHRVFLTGHSNGGAMTYRLAEALSPRIAAIATVAGMVASEHPRATRPMPSLYILGTKDPLMPEAGGDAPVIWGARRTLPVVDYLARWAAALGTATSPVLVSNKDGLRIDEYRPGGQDGATLTVVRVEGQGHGWPGAKVNRLGERLIGPITNHLDATDMIWKFFAAAASR
jgi:polyhydroxybutyrate depolymerase